MAVQGSRHQAGRRAARRRLPGAGFPALCGRVLFPRICLPVFFGLLLLGSAQRVGASETEGAASGEGMPVYGVEVPIQETESPGSGQEEDPAAAGEEAGLPNGKSAYNILLVGTDHRDTSWNGNSDVMILATISEEKETIFLTSFMRDLWADIPGYGVHKLNYAYAAGGAETLVAALEDNYELEIDHYAVVDFDTMAEIVDLVGGVEIEVSEEECRWLNGYLDSMDASDDALPGGGTYLLNGNQAVAYMRIRFVGNNDYERTQRQRDVLTQIFASMQEVPVEELLPLAVKVLSKVDHDISLLDLAPVAATVVKAVHYDLEEGRIPYDGLYYSENEMLVPDFPATIARLHETLYGG